MPSHMISERNGVILREGIGIPGLAALPSRTLFYPCSCEDIVEPVLMFAPYINQFWFVDVGYFNQPPMYTRPIFDQSSPFILKEKSVSYPDLPEEDWMTDRKYRGIAPVILTEVYLHLPSQELVTIHRHRRRGPSALRKEVNKISIFFYRGDSDEGGSGTFWLTSTKRAVKHGRDLPALIIDKLDAGGWLVTDGSMCYGEVWHNPYLFLIRKAREIKKTQALDDFEATDPWGNWFELIGFGPPKDRPLLFWRITKAKQE